MSDDKPMALFVVAAEVRKDRGIGSTDLKTEAEVMADLYQPTTLVMAFDSPEELALLRQALKGAQE